MRATNQDRATELVEARGFVPDGHTRQDAFKVGGTITGHRLVTVGGRRRYRVEGTDQRASVGPRTVCFYLYRAGQTLGHETYRTADLAGIQKWLEENLPRP